MVPPADAARVISGSAVHVDEILVVPGLVGAVGCPDWRAMMATVSGSSLAAVQMASGCILDANLLEAERLVREAAGQGAGLVVLPENFALMGRHDADLLEVMEPDGSGPLQDFLAGLARQCGVWLVGGTIPLRCARGDRCRAASLVFDAHGKRVARYDKIHLFDVRLPNGEAPYCESATIEPGDAVVTLDTPFGRLGLAVCYDLRFPELFRRLLDAGAELVALPAAFTALTGQAHWAALVRARAIENQVYMVAAAQGGFHVSGRETHGHSMVVDPWGVVLGELGRGSGVAVAERDRDLPASVRRDFPVIGHRRLQCDG